MYKIAIADGQPLLQSVGAQLQGLGEIDVVDVAWAGIAENSDILRDADALMVSVHPVTAALLADMPRCRIVSRIGTGLDAIDLPAAAALGVWVANTPDYATDEVSTHAMTLLLAYARKLPALLALPKQGIWQAGPVGPIRRLRGQTLGLVGFGRIGQAVCAKARGMGLHVLAHDAYVPSDAMVALGAEPADLDTLLSRSDFISLHAPLSDDTARIIDARALALVKPTAVLINTARGPLIDEDALLSAIREGRIAGAALDVLTIEPPAPDHPFFAEERIWITPHAGWYSESSLVDAVEGASENIALVLRGGPPRTPVNAPDLAASRWSS